MLHQTPQVETLIDQALAEDLSLGDPTTEALLSPTLMGVGVIKAKTKGILAGVEVALAVFRRVDPSLKTISLIKDGSSLSPGDRIARIEGLVSGILKAERTALNFLQRMSGIATETDRYVRAVEGLKTRIVDTRKTTPGLRTLEKYAVSTGGGHNHRRSLGDGMLIKDNHIAALRSLGLTIKDIMKEAQSRASHTIKIEIEVETLEQLQEALEAGAQLILLDNMEMEKMRLAVKMCRGKAITEASGGINLETVRAVAETGVDIISVGALTHSVKALDISLELEI